MTSGLDVVGQGEKSALKCDLAFESHGKQPQCVALGAVEEGQGRAIAPLFSALDPICVHATFFAPAQTWAGRKML